MPSGHRPQPPVGTARVAISGEGAGSNPFVNVMWLRLTATTHVAADLKSIIDSMEAAYATRFKASISSAWTIAQAKASWLYASGQVVEYTGTYADNGTAGAEATDATCAVINWAISDYYRGGHPRTYLPGVPDASVIQGNALSNAYVSALATGAAGFITDVNALTHGGISAVELGTVRFASGNQWLSPPVFKAYSSASVRKILGTQRRRLGGR